VIKVDCAEFQHSHEIAKLIGSPPGYLGHRETHPLITQEALAQHHTEGLKLSFLLFDEIEKASDALWQLLLGILDKATLTLGDNRRVDLSGTMIFLTSNLGGGEITELMTGGLGFVQSADKGEDKLDSKVERMATEAVKRAIERNIVYPLANLLATEQVRLGDMLCINWDLSEGRLIFQKEGERAVLPGAALQPRQPGIRVASAGGGRPADVPSAKIPREGQQPPVILPPGSPSPAPANRRKNENET